MASTRALSIAVPRTDNPLARSVERQLRRCERMADDFDCLSDVDPGQVRMPEHFRRFGYASTGIVQASAKAPCQLGVIRDPVVPAASPVMSAVH